MNENQAYLLVKLELENADGGKVAKKSVDLGEDYLLHNVVHGLTKLYGQAGAAAPVDIHQLVNTDKKTSQTELVLSCPHHFVKKLGASLTLQGSYQGQLCVYTVLEVSSDPSSLIPSARKSAASDSHQRYF